jgi:catechol 2,3-dioxygenase-like lactoylglutathione lyase family enzyme
MNPWGYRKAGERGLAGTSRSFDRAAEDVGNIVALEHVNVWVPDQVAATAFYVLGLGLTRDPYLMVGLDNMWINAGQQQFHLPTGDPQVLRGVVGLVVPDLDALVARLKGQEGPLAGTRFAWAREGEHVLATCPWGNRIRCHAAGTGWGRLRLGIPYVEFPVAPGHAAGIARFYREVMGAPATLGLADGSPAARVCAGPGQQLVFRETAADPGPYDGHHIAIYVADFSGPHGRLRQRGLITEESNPVQYRFEDIVDPDTGRVLFTVEHEVRSLTHPMYLRPMVNRNPAQRQATYQPGRDAWVPEAT